MAWVRPVGFEDPDDKWINEELAFDDDVATYAEWPDMVKNRFSPLLVLRFPTIVADELRLFIGFPDNLSHWRIMLYDGLVWTFAPEPDDLTGWDWRSVTFPKQTVTKIELRFLNYGSPPNPGGVAEVVLNWVCRGPLVAICEFLGKGGEFFDGLADDLADWAIVGDALAGPFRSLSGLFNTASNTCCVASSALQDVLDSLEGGFTWAGFLALLQDYAPTLYYLIVNPVGEILYLIGQAFDIDPWHLKSLDALTKYALQTYLPWLYQFWLDPTGWFEAVLQERFPVLYYLWRDPKGQVLYLIGLAFDLTPYEAQSPEFIVKALFERYFPELYLIWRDPDGWLLARLGPILDAILEEFKDLLELSWDKLLDLYEDAFEGISSKLYSLVERTLRFFWEGAWQQK